MNVVLSRNDAHHVTNKGYSTFPETFLRLRLRKKYSKSPSAGYILIK